MNVPCANCGETIRHDDEDAILIRGKWIHDECSTEFSYCDRCGEIIEMNDPSLKVESQPCGADPATRLLNGPTSVEIIHERCVQQGDILLEAYDQ